MRQLSAKLSSPRADHAGRAEPERPLHDGARSPQPAMTPLACRIGTNTAQQSVPADEHGHADPHAGDGAGGEKDEIPGKDDGAARSRLRSGCRGATVCSSVSKRAARKALEARADRVDSPSAQNLSTAAISPATPSALAARMPLRARASAARAASRPPRRRSGSAAARC